MTSATQLIKYVMDNDYETIEKLIQSKKKLNWDCQDRKGFSILYRAVETRAKECFNLLIDSDLDLRTSEALNKAMDYYSAAPNPVNEHYLMRLLDSHQEVDAHVLNKFFDNPHMFNHLFSKINHNSDTIGRILKDSIEKFKPAIFKQVFDMLEETRPDYWVQTNSLAQKIFKWGIDWENVDVMNSVKNRINWKQVESTPSIYYALNESKFSSFNYLMGLLESLDKNEIEQIPHIKNLNTLFSSVYDLNNFDKKFGDFFNGLKRILKLELEFNKTEIIANIFKIATNTFYSRYSYNVANGRLNLYFVSWWLIKNKLITTNPYNELASKLPNLTNVGSYYAIQNKTMYKEYIKNFDYILSHFNFEPNETIIKNYDLRGENFSTEKTKFIETLELREKEFEPKPPKITPVKKSGGKKTKKDIEV